MPADNPGAIVLTSARATCAECGHEVSQIDTTRARAVQVVTDAMNRHLKEAHQIDRTGWEEILP